MFLKTKITAILLLSISSVLYGQLKLPVLSPKAKVSQTAGFTEIDITYSRPSARGRKVFGEKGIVPFGEFWRTGANAVTKITFSKPVTIGGVNLKKGDYVVLTKPNKLEWKLFLYPYKEQNWGKYVSKEPLVAMNLKRTSISEKVESFQISFQNITFDTVDVVFEWGNTRIQLPVQLNTKTESVKNIKRAFEEPSPFDYFQAAVYLHETKTDLKQALKYIQKVTSGKNALFFQVHREALILSDLGRNKEALVAAKKSLALSKSAKNDDFVRLNENLISKLNK
jgi:hypothetical protein